MVGFHSVVLWFLKETCWAVDRFRFLPGFLESS